MVVELEARTCLADGCNKPLKCRGLCDSCYNRWRRGGVIPGRDPWTPSTQYAPNEIRIIGNTAVMDLYKNDHSVACSTIFDAEEVDKRILPYRWGRSGGGQANYVVRRIADPNHPPGYRLLSLARIIMNAPGGMVVDHINRNPLDNRKKNLRVVTQQENTWNRGQKGIYREGEKGLWRVSITRLCETRLEAQDQRQVWVEARIAVGKYADLPN